MHLHRRALLAASAAAAALVAGAAYAQPTAEPAEGNELEQVVVTGTAIRTPGFQPSSPLDVVSLEALQNKPAQNLSLFAKNLPYNLGGSFVQSGGGGGNPVAGFVNLRGLGRGATLVLINSRRAARFASDQSAVDVDSLAPEIAIQSVEVLKDGASATYGSDAVAGVFNVRTRSRFSGFEFRGDVNHATYPGKTDYKVQGIIGGGNDKAHLMLAASYAASPEYGFVDIEDFRGLPSNTAPGTPGVLRIPRRDAAGALLTATTVRADPLCGVVPGSVVTGTAAAPSCSTDFLPDQYWAAKTRRYNLFTQGEYAFSDSLKLKLEASYAHADADNYGSKTNAITNPLTVPYTNPGVIGDLRIPARTSTGQQLYAVPDPTNPAIALRDSAGRVVLTATPTSPVGGVAFFEDIGYTGRPIGNQGQLPTGGNFPFANGEYVRQFGRRMSIEDTVRFVTALEGNLFGDWTWEASLNYAQNEVDSKSMTNTDVPNLSLALRGLGGIGCNPATGRPGVGPCQYFNPFGNAIYATPGTPQANTQAIIDFVSPTTIDRFSSSIIVAEVSASGTVIELPAGALTAAVGLQQRKERWVADYDTYTNQGRNQTGNANADTALSRRVRAVYGEVGVPVFDDESYGKLSLNLAIRHEDGGGAYKTTDPKIGGTYTLWGDRLQLRGSYGTSFLAPSLAQLNPRAGGLYVTDPLFPGTLTPIGTTVEGSEGLTPQSADVYSFGFRVEPIERLTITLDRWSYDFQDLIAQTNAQTIINANPRDPRIRRDPGSGLIINVNAPFFNAASVKTSGIDFTVVYRLPTDGFGDFTFDLNGTRQDRYDIQASATSPVQDRLGNWNNTTFGGPSIEWRLLGGVTWAMGPHTLNVSAAYSSAIDNDRAIATFPGDAKIDAHTTVDVSYFFELPQMFGLESGKVGVGAENVFDNQADVVGFSSHNVQGVYDYTGRKVWARVTAGF